MKKYEAVAIGRDSDVFTIINQKTEEVIFSCNAKRICIKGDLEIDGNLFISGETRIINTTVINRVFDDAEKNEYLERIF